MKSVDRIQEIIKLLDGISIEEWEGIKAHLDSFFRRKLFRFKRECKVCADKDWEEMKNNATMF